MESADHPLTICGPPCSYASATAVSSYTIAYQRSRRSVSATRYWSVSASK
jgi:hypothetical protein